jgi:AcrR family transcriptional regulator
MPRPSRALDQRLLIAARQLVEAKGFSALTVRAVAARARVNPGMFHYHFKNRRVFKQRMFGLFYEDFFREFLGALGDEKDPVLRLRRALTFLGTFIRDHRGLGLALVQDALAGDADTLALIRTHFLRHGRLILEALAEGQAAGRLRPTPLPNVIVSVLGTVGLPFILLEALRRAGTREPFGFPWSVFEEAVSGDAGLAERIQLLIRGLSRGA